ncbi:hypothetical protein [Tenacibaculum caenipelagi]|uniref:Uncharacterized protein n=1 Tax=Tenacibaculum caenipelagi TaxID=1325435 RepID=A0A4R6TE79_9FLAO|nr:hypothetical protein [Tenacibaculum caenipelagi]TDQ27828.1 hypothetical protein DFQ07_1684 [Tenacibaculum caenipelagi]
MYEAKHSYNLKEGEIELFIDEREFYKQRRELTTRTLKYQHQFEQANDNLISLDLSKESNPNYNDDIVNLLDEYRKSTISNLKGIFEERNKVIQLLSSYIKKLME